MSVYILKRCEYLFNTLQKPSDECVDILWLCFVFVFFLLLAGCWVTELTCWERKSQCYTKSRQREDQNVAEPMRLFHQARDILPILEIISWGKLIRKQNVYKVTITLIPLYYLIYKGTFILKQRSKKKKYMFKMCLF